MVRQKVQQCVKMPLVVYISLARCSFQLSRDRDSGGGGGAGYGSERIVDRDLGRRIPRSCLVVLLKAFLRSLLKRRYENTSAAENATSIATAFL